MDTSSTTMPLTFSNRLNMFFIRRFLSPVFLNKKHDTENAPSHLGIQRLTDEPPPTKTTQEPKKAGENVPGTWKPS